MKRLLNLDTLTVLRVDSGSLGEYDDDGNWVKGDGSTGQFTVEASLQPVTGEDLELLPSGLKKTDVRKVYTPTELKTVDEDAGTEPDVIIIDGKNYEVQTVEPWKGRRLAHFKCILTKEEKTG